MGDFLHQIMFATGIECSYPTVEGGKRRDELESTRHYQYWRTDFDLCKEVGADYVRYGIPYYKIHTGPGKYDWSFPDEVLPVLKAKGLVPIMDLCHFGVPDWIGSFQNPDWPGLFADYAEAFVQRYPWVQYFTPVNEILVCSRMSGKKGIWNEQHKSDCSLVRNAVNMCRATIEATHRILHHQPKAVFFQSEICEVILEQYPETRDEVEFKNQLRFLSFDLLYGHQPQARILELLMDCGMTKDEFEWFMHHGRDARLRCIMGTDYYSHNERVQEPDGSEKGVGPCLGWAQIAQHYFDRYRKPIMLTETNTMDKEKGPSWLWTIWHNVSHLRRAGVPVVGLTWFSLQDQVDWDIQLAKIRNKVNPNGLYDLDRRPNPVAATFREISNRYGREPIVPDFAMGGIEGPAVEREGRQMAGPPISGGES